MIAIIPARGGSKGLPGKNIMNLCGKPLIAYSIESALESEYIKHVIVSTDDKEIADISLRYGAEVPFLRPEYLATDTAQVIDNYIYTIDKLSREWGEAIDEFIVLQPTSPLRSSKDINEALKLFRDKDADSVISYTSEAHPIHWHKYLNPDGSFVNIFNDTTVNRQDFRKSYYPNGAIYIFKYKIIQKRKYYTDNSFAYIMPRMRSVDIDYLEDFQMAEFLLTHKSDIHI